MPFGTLIAQSVNYEPRQPGEYHKSGLTYADPANYFRFRPGSTRKDDLRTIGVTRTREKDVTVGSDTVRKATVISLNVLTPSDGSFTAAEIDSMLLDISEVLTATIIDRQLQGES